MKEKKTFAINACAGLVLLAVLIAIAVYLAKPLIIN